MVRWLFGGLLLVVACAQPVPYVADCSAQTGCDKGCCDKQGACHKYERAMCGTGAGACSACGPDESCLTGTCRVVEGDLQVNWRLGASGASCRAGWVADVLWAHSGIRDRLGTVPCSDGHVVQHVGLDNGWGSSVQVNITNAQGTLVYAGSAPAVQGPGKTVVDVTAYATPALTELYEVGFTLPAYRDAGPDDCWGRDIAFVEVLVGSQRVAAGGCTDFPKQLELPAVLDSLTLVARNETGLRRAQTAPFQAPALPSGQLRRSIVPMHWEVGGIAYRWSFASDAGALDCADAGVTELRLAFGYELQLTVPCADDAGVEGVALEFAPAGFYATLNSNVISGRYWWASNVPQPTRGVFFGEGAPTVQVELQW